MSSSSSSAAAVMSFGFSLIGCPVSEKLSKHNFPLWSLQEHYIEPDTEVPPRKIAKDSTKPTELSDNLEYKEWVAKDQQIVNYLLSSITKEVMVQVSNCTTSAEMWRVIQEMTASQSRGRIINTRMALATAQKGSSTIAEYFSKMKSLADDMASAGKRLEDEEIASFILAGLDAEYNPIVSSVTSRGKEPLSLRELYTQLVSWEQRIDLQNGGGSSSSVKASTPLHVEVVAVSSVEEQDVVAVVAAMAAMVAARAPTTRFANSVAKMATSSCAATNASMLPSRESRNSARLHQQPTPTE